MYSEGFIQEKLGYIPNHAVEVGMYKTEGNLFSSAADDYY